MPLHHTLKSAELSVYCRRRRPQPPTRHTHSISISVLFSDLRVCEIVCIWLNRLCTGMW
jgi:hypothetical protein